MEMNTVKTTACTSCLRAIKNKIPQAYYPYNIACKSHASIIEKNMDMRKFNRQKISEKRNVRILSPDGEIVMGQVLDIHPGGFRLNLLRPIKVGQNLEGLIETTYGRAFPHYVPFTASSVWVKQGEAGFRFLQTPKVRKDIMDILIYQYQSQKKNNLIKKYQSSLKRFILN